MAVVGPFSRRDDGRALPLPAGPVSNGEFVPAAPSARQEDQRADPEGGGRRGRRVGVDRRLFLQGAGAVAASLAAFE